MCVCVLIFLSGTEYLSQHAPHFLVAVATYTPDERNQSINQSSVSFVYHDDRSQLLTLLCDAVCMRIIWDGGSYIPCITKEREKENCKFVTRSMNLRRCFRSCLVLVAAIFCSLTVASRRRSMNTTTAAFLSPSAQNRKKGVDARSFFNGGFRDPSTTTTTKLRRSKPLDRHEIEKDDDSDLSNLVNFLTQVFNEFEKENGLLEDMGEDEEGRR